MPSLTTAMGRPDCSSLSASQSDQRSYPSRVAHEPWVIESPNATTAPLAAEDNTSIDLSHMIAAVVAVNGFASSTAERSPEPSGLR